ncbi:hypothetical protein P153DRAFT_112866 [Dothidotthia symphoricarpi CBS 119687]|uniref:Uncharacterized protein n=1 Tax=Dothidotthia symphoricarpi CBS 119687 TaxID=1392245 RepID=A0A6A6A4A4_9PLEO|nr:uncharacterized protein P153DRAFT_112866 [Dothidotthia symphoricarpi CBS 119687]KAF2125421.1 hypothetical protein P153DRAFT_112866 [Dothidotthia symphoricarpi CBS 119687]
MAVNALAVVSCALCRLCLRKKPIVFVPNSANSRCRLPIILLSTSLYALECSLAFHRSSGGRVESNARECLILRVVR